MRLAPVSDRSGLRSDLPGCRSQGGGSRRPAWSISTPRRCTQEVLQVGAERVGMVPRLPGHPDRRTTTHRATGLPGIRPASSAPPGRGLWLIETRALDPRMTARRRPVRMCGLPSAATGTRSRNHRVSGGRRVVTVPSARPDRRPRPPRRVPARSAGRRGRPRRAGGGVGGPAGRPVPGAPARQSDQREQSLWHWAYNRGKKSVTLDSVDVEALCRSADVLIESRSRSARHRSAGGGATRCSWRCRSRRSAARVRRRGGWRRTSRWRRRAASWR